MGLSCSERAAAALLQRSWLESFGKGLIPSSIAMKPVALALAEASSASKRLGPCKEKLHAGRGWNGKQHRAPGEAPNALSAAR